MASIQEEGGVAHLDAFSRSCVGWATDELKELNASLSEIHVQGQPLPAGVLAVSGVEAPPK